MHPAQLLAVMISHGPLVHRCTYGRPAQYCGGSWLQWWEHRTRAKQAEQPLTKNSLHKALVTPPPLLPPPPPPGKRHHSAESAARKACDTRCAQSLVCMPIAARKGCIKLIQGEVVLPWPPHSASHSYNGRHQALTVTNRQHGVGKGAASHNAPLKLSTPHN